MTITYTNSKNSDFIDLCKQLDHNLNEMIGIERQGIYDQYNQLNEINDVCIAYENNVPVGCAAFKHYKDKVAEVKRVFVMPEYRGNGISKLLMKSLEEKALEKGYVSFILETGRLLKVAIHLYRHSGYIIIENYGQYKGLPESVCMQKSLY